MTLKVLDRVRARLATPAAGAAPLLQIRMLVRTEDAAAVDWTVPAPWSEPRATVQDRPLRTAWIMHPPGESSGGHQNIFRFIDYLEKAGHEATVYLYHSADHRIDARYLESLLHKSPSYPSVRARFHEYHGQVASDIDAIFATGWETAYPAYLDPSPARRFYFVQDFEPAFYPVGTEHVFAENTYRFGFHGITAGAWLSDRLTREYGMRAESFDFAADLSNYTFRNEARRDELFFYARPVTTRRGFELGAMALEQVARARPDVTLHLAGWDVSNYDLPFRYVNHAAMRVTDLDELYNRCGAALVLSLTNMSLLPLELLASGVIPVINNGPNNSMVSNNPYLRYCDPTPKALARTLLEVLDRPDQSEHARAAAQSVAGLSWDASGKQFVSIVEGAMHG
ncbi:glycosyltransferase family 4 protein [Cellulomonas hominis]|uniref:glycosyltransferase family 4 protein n=1 Tax=Cellulomonas hominis TaxID=156981 RepID=UPI001443FDD3|nr:glycosyltransferase family 4 protein [Cellulomonas hominis]NKY09923.1 glycosyltransferase family 4 protein [Cellulomonas hominis]